MTDAQDPRFLRSRERLRAAVLEVAAERPVDDITVTEVCRTAAVTRDTFYRHAGSPTELLVAALEERFETVARAHRDADGGVPPEGFGGAERALLAHVLEHRAVYRSAMRPVLLAPLRAALEAIVAEGLVTHLLRHPESLPAGVDVDDAEALELVAGYAAAGTIGAIERWIVGTQPDVERGARLILAASPEFWFRPFGGRPPV